jgi:anti-anti-sigma regulatory factor
MIIIDLTGVQQITSGAVYAFSESLDAARLLGAVPILVGIQAQVAEALSDLDIGTLDVEMDLQAGLKHATAALEKNPR